jgi:hypothetical protein
VVHNVEVVERDILMSGVDDWVHIPEALYFARREIGVNASEMEALSVVIEAAKNLLRQGLIEVGEVTDTFTPWVGSLNEIEHRIDQTHAQAKSPVRFGDLFWISNTPRGDERGEQLLAQAKETQE